MTEIIENIESFNKDIVSWGHRTRQTILGKIPKGRHASGAKEEPLARSFRMNTSKTFGEIDRIGFSFSLHGVFLQKGVGRGYISKNGVVRRTDKSFQKSQNKINRLQNHSRRYLQAQTGLVQRSIAIQIRKLIGSCC